MRPLIVLLLVLVAAVVLIISFTTMGGGGSKDGAVPEAAAPVSKGPAKPTDTLVPPPTSTEQGVRSAPDEKINADPKEQDAVVISNSLFGTVLNDQAQPVVKATVILSKDAMMGDALGGQLIIGQAPTGKFLQQETNAKGEYRFKDVEPANDYYLVARHPDYSPKQEQLISVAEQGDTRAPDLILKAGSTISGLVTDEGNSGIPNARLDLESAFFPDQGDSPDLMRTVTDGTGHYEIKNVPADARVLTVSADGFGTQTQMQVPIKGTPGEVLTIDFKLLAGQPIGGRVVGSDGLGVVGAKISAFSTGQNQSYRGEAVSIEDGQFRIDNLHPGSYILQAEAKGYRQQKHTRQQTGDLTVQIDMLAQACVEGRVIQAGNGNPVPSFSITVRRVSQPQGQGTAKVYEDTGVVEVVNDSADGTFRLCGLDPGTYALMASSATAAPTLSDTFQVIENQRVTNLVVRLSAGGSIKGRVVGPDGAPVRGAVVSSHDDTFDEDPMESFFGGLVPSNVTQRKARTDSQGNFELRLLTPETYQIRITHPSYTREKMRKLQVIENTPTDVGTIQLRTGGTVSGTVIGSGGTKLARAFVHLESDMGDLVYDTRTDAEGRYSLQHVSPGTYTLSATGQNPGGGDAFQGIVDQRTSAVKINVIDGQPVTRDLSLGG
jgi:carboxypeptidase family protein